MRRQPIATIAGFPQTKRLSPFPCQPSKEKGHPDMAAIPQLPSFNALHSAQQLPSNVSKKSPRP
jgi:hypothetical protein